MPVGVKSSANFSEAFVVDHWVLAQIDSFYFGAHQNCRHVLAADVLDEIVGEIKLFQFEFFYL